MYLITRLRWTGLDWTHKTVRNKLINHRKQTKHTQNLTHYTLNFIFYKSAIDTLHEPYLHFCYELALETSAKRSSIKSLRVMSSAMPTD